MPVTSDYYGVPLSLTQTTPRVALYAATPRAITLAKPTAGFTLPSLTRVTCHSQRSILLKNIFYEISLYFRSANFPFSLLVKVEEVLLIITNMTDYYNFAFKV